LIVELVHSIFLRLLLLREWLMSRFFKRMAVLLGRDASIPGSELRGLKLLEPFREEDAPGSVLTQRRQFDEFFRGKGASAPLLRYRDTYRVQKVSSQNHFAVYQVSTLITTQTSKSMTWNCSF
jgi:hypothetical protein